MKKTLMLVMLLGLAGCVHYMPAAVSSASLGAKERPIGVAYGHADASYFLFIGPNGDDSLAAAIKNAKGTTGADTMVNVFVDRRETCFPSCAFSLFTNVSTMVYGTLVKYESGAPVPQVGSSGSDGPITPQQAAVRSFLSGLIPGDRIRIVTASDRYEGRFGSLDAGFVSIRTAPLLPEISLPVKSIIRVERIEAPLPKPKAASPDGGVF